MSNGDKMSRPEARMTSLGSAAVQFRVDYKQAKMVGYGKSIHSGIVWAGGHPWRIEWFPVSVFEGEEYFTIQVRHMGKIRSVRALFEAFLLDSYRQPCREAQKRVWFSNFPINNGCQDDFGVGGWSDFITRTTLEREYVFEGHFTFVVAIMVVQDSLVGAVPPSDIGSDLGRLLDTEEGTDVSFVIDGEMLRAHRAVLAARSPVFRAELFGSMAEATMPSITLHDITPATFKVMLRFIYTDELFSREDELLVDSTSVEMFQNLLAAADRYALDRMKLMCAQTLWDKVTVDTVATILACAETYNCPDLKNKCFKFFVSDINFKKAVFTDGFAMLVQKFPSITAELRERVET
ncbi:unnamed protein product [Alopecurus aequalis]